MFTKNFFYDNSQLNFGKHLSKSLNLNKKQKLRLSNVIDSVKKTKLNKKTTNRQQRQLFLTIGFIIALGIVISAFEWKTYDKYEVVSLQSIQMEQQELLEIPPTEQPSPPPPKKMAVKIITVSDLEEVEEKIDIDLDIETNELMILEEVTYNDVEVDVVEEEEVEEIFLIVEKSPEPVGGLNAFYSYVAKEINYPTRARRAHIGGRVFIQFVVNIDGSLSDFEVIKGIGLGCDEEAVRVLKGAPNWTPGKQRGREVRVRMVLPIYFELRDNN